MTCWDLCSNPLDPLMGQHGLPAAAPRRATAHRGATNDARMSNRELAGYAGAMTSSELPSPPPTTPARTVGRFTLAAMLVFAGCSHLFWARDAFRAQVPESIPLDADGVVMASGGVEVTLGAGLALIERDRVLAGRLLAAFFVAVFPGNIAQFVHKRDGFGLNSDTSRFIRLLFQPVLVALALWSTGVPRDSR